MTSFVSVLVMVGLLFQGGGLAIRAQDARPAMGCAPVAENRGYQYYFPMITKGARMNISAIESIESLIERQAQETLDGRIVEIFEEAVTVRPVGSDRVRPNIPIPGHIDKDDLSLGQAVRLGIHQGQPILLAVLDNFVEDVNYSGLGQRLPTPPLVTVIATRDGWAVSWARIPGADSYQVYINDTQDGVTPTEVGIFTQTALVIPYDGDPPTDKYVGVVAISGQNESEASAWVTDSTAPFAPTTFTATNAVAGHLLDVDGDEPSLNDASFRCWEIEQALDGSGTGAVSLGYFYPADLPSLQPFGAGTVRYYRARALDWAGNTSDWTSWDYACAGQSEVQDKFDGYGGEAISDLESLWWLQITDWDFEGEVDGGTGTWETISAQAQIQRVANIASGTFSVYTYSTLSPIVPVMYLDYIYPTDIALDAEGRFADPDDKISIVLYLENISNINTGSSDPFLMFEDNGGLKTRGYYDPNNFVSGFNYITLDKSDFVDDTGFSWDLISQVIIQIPVQSGVVTTLTAKYDDLRIVKADPDDATDYNDTGRAWDKAAQTGTDHGEWHIYAGNRLLEPGKSYSYGQIKTAASPAQWYLSHKPLAETNIISGTVQAGVYLKNDDGAAGLAFFIKDVTAGSWEMYAVEVDSAADTVSLVKWVAGTRTVIASASFASALHQIVWLGVDFKDYERDGGRLKVYASLVEGNLIQAANLVISTQDTSLTAGGSVGLLSKQANVRFVNFVAGSPAHAETADVARSLDGPIIAGASKRVRYNPDDDLFERSTDGETWTEVIGNVLPLAGGTLTGDLVLDGADVNDGGESLIARAWENTDGWQEQFRSGIIPTGYSWISDGTFNGTPSTLSYNSDNDYLRVSGVGGPYFLARSMLPLTTSSFAYMRNLPNQSGAIGWRIDDGTSSNYVNIYTYQTPGGLITLYLEQSAGATLSAGPYFFPKFFRTVFRAYTSGGSYAAQFYVGTQSGTFGIILSATLSSGWAGSGWRTGLLVPATAGFAYCDGFQDNIS